MHRPGWTVTIPNAGGRCLRRSSGGLPRCLAAGGSRAASRSSPRGAAAGPPRPPSRTGAADAGGAVRRGSSRPVRARLPVPDATVAADKLGNSGARHRLGAVDQLVALDAALGQILGDIADFDALG